MLQRLSKSDFVLVKNWTEALCSMFGVAPPLASTVCITSRPQNEPLNTP